MNTYPSIIFIVPYRNRITQRIDFTKHMKEVILEDAPEGSYEIYFAHQRDDRTFNRGAMKNIGFIAMKNKYPASYKNFTFVFNDVDTYPVNKCTIDYNTSPGIVKHFYGFEFALGGIFSIKGADFERTLGFPNLWGWGIEDNVIYERCLKSGLTIDRTQFYKMGDSHITQIFDGFNRVVSKREGSMYKYETLDNIRSVTNLNYKIYKDDIIVTHFKCSREPTDDEYFNYDIRKGNVISIQPGYFRRSWKLFN